MVHYSLKSLSILSDGTLLVRGNLVGKGKRDLNSLRTVPDVQLFKITADEAAPVKDQFHKCQLKLTVS